MLQTRSSSSEQFQSTHSGQSAHAQQQQQQQQQPRLVQMPRNNIQSHSGGSGYRGTSAAPSYAFKATPHLRNENKVCPASTSTMLQPSAAENIVNGNKQRYPTHGSTSTTSSSSSNPSSNLSSNNTTWSQTLFAKDDSVLGSNFEVAPFTTQPSASSNHSANPTTENLSKPSPNRYRRANGKAETTNTPSKTPQNANTVNPMGQFTYNASQGTLYSQKLSNGLPKSNGEINDAVQQAGTTVSAPEAEPERSAPNPQSALSMKRYRRRSSLGTLDINGGAKGPSGSDDVKVAPANPAADFPSSPHEAPRPPSVSTALIRSEMVEVHDLMHFLSPIANFHTCKCSRNTMPDLHHLVALTANQM